MLWTEVLYGVIHTHYVTCTVIDVPHNGAIFTTRYTFLLTATNIHKAKALHLLLDKEHRHYCQQASNIQCIIWWDATMYYATRCQKHVVLIEGTHTYMIILLYRRRILIVAKPSYTRHDHHDWHDQQNNHTRKSNELKRARKFEKIDDDDFCVLHGYDPHLHLMGWIWMSPRRGRIGRTWTNE